VILASEPVLAACIFSLTVKKLKHVPPVPNTGSRKLGLWLNLLQNFTAALMIQAIQMESVTSTCTLAAEKTQLLGC